MVLDTLSHGLDSAAVPSRAYLDAAAYRPTPSFNMPNTTLSRENQDERIANDRNMDIDAAVAPPAPKSEPTKDIDFIFVSTNRYDEINPSLSCTIGDFLPRVECINAKNYRDSLPKEITDVPALIVVSKEVITGTNLRSRYIIGSSDILEFITAGLKIDITDSSNRRPTGTGGEGPIDARGQKDKTDIAGPDGDIDEMTSNSNNQGPTELSNDAGELQFTSSFFSETFDEKNGKISETTVESMMKSRDADVDL